MFMKMYDEKKKKDAETNKSNQIKSNQIYRIFDLVTMSAYIMLEVSCLTVAMSPDLGFNSSASILSTHNCHNANIAALLE